MPGKGQHINQAPLNQPQQHVNAAPQQAMNIENNGLLNEELKELERQKEELEIEAIPEILNAENIGCPNLTILDRTIKNRSKNLWARNYDECAKLAKELNRKAHKRYKKFKKNNRHEEGNAANWLDLNRAAERLNAEIKRRDAEQKAIWDDTTVASFDAEIDELLADRGSRDTALYTAIYDAALAYKREKDTSYTSKKGDKIENFANQLNHVEQLQKALITYANARYRKHYGTIPGRKRMTRVSKLIAMTDKLMMCKKILDIQQNDSDKFNVVEKESNGVWKNDIAKAFKKLDDNGQREEKSRWAQVMLYCERDKNGKLTEDGKENFIINRKLLRAFQSDDVERQIAAVGRIFLKQGLGQFDKNSFTEGNLLNYCQQRYTKDSVHGNIGEITNLLTQIKKNKGYENHPLVTYMMNRAGNMTDNSMYSVLSFFPKSVGYDFAEKKRVDVAVGKSVVEECLAEAKRTFELQKPAENAPDEEKDTYEAEHYCEQNEAIEDQLRQLIAQADEAEKEEDVVRQYPSNVEYVEDTIKVKVVKDQLYKNVEDYLNSDYPQYMDEGQIEVKYWTHYSRIPELLLPCTCGKNGKPVKASKENFADNDKMLRLLYSKDAEDRIAALAFVYLRMKISNLDVEDVTKENMNVVARDVVMTSGFLEQYTTISDYIEDELKRSKDNELLRYMKRQLEKDAAVINLVSTSFLANGYALDGSVLNENDKQGNARAYDMLIENAKNIIQKTKDKNGGKLIEKDNKMEEKLKTLCKSKSLL